MLQRVLTQPLVALQASEEESLQRQGCARAGVRVDTWVESGTEVTPFYDSLLGKLMVHGSSRDDAISRMVAALSGTVLAGIPSNLEYCSAIVGSPGFREGEALFQTLKPGTINATAGTAKVGLLSRPQRNVVHAIPSPVLQLPGTPAPLRLHQLTRSRPGMPLTCRCRMSSRIRSAGAHAQ